MSQVLKKTLAFGLVFALALVSGCGAQHAPTEPTTATNTVPVFVNDYSGDAELLVEQIEATHPIFSIPAIPDGYDAARAEFLEACAEPMTRDAFLLSTQKYLASLGDGHMSGWSADFTQFLNVNWVAAGDKLFFAGENGAPTDVEVTHIGGVETRAVMSVIDQYFVHENGAARRLRYAAFCRAKDIIELAGGASEGGAAEVVSSDGTAETVSYITSSLTAVYGYKPYSEIIKSEMLDDVFYIYLRSFRPDKSVDDVCAQIGQAVEDGVTKFIIDVRGNPGGNSSVGEQLLRALGMELPSYGGYIRYSALSKAHHGGADSGYDKYDPYPGSAVRNEDVTLIVLTDVLTFSSATMLGVWVQDGGLGKIVGQTSSNSPTAYGDMLSLSLPKSGFSVNISYKQFLRPDASADQHSLIPDIEVPLGEDILQAALEYMDNIG